MYWDPAPEDLLLGRWGQPSMGAVVASGEGRGLAPILVECVAGLIGRAFRSKRGGRRTGLPASQKCRGGASGKARHS
jgi:hypothetical protein